MKKKRILLLLLALTLIVSGLPLAVHADENTQPGDLSPQTESSGEADASEAPDDPAKDQETPGKSTVSSTSETESSQQQPSSEETESTEPPTEDTQNQNEETNKVVTIGNDLSEKQKASMYEYFGTAPEQVKTIVVTHADEVKYMEGIATAKQIGKTTYSCAYVEPTDSGGVRVKTANLNFVTSAMIASTLTTAGVENCNVIAACPFEVSGTGALTGVIMAYEKANDQNLDEGQKEAAMEELITTGNLADSIGQEQAIDLVNDVKTQVIGDNLTDPSEIQSAVEDAAKDHDVNLTDAEKEQITQLMEKISQYDYDLGTLKDTLNNLDGKLSGLSGIWHSIKSFFVGNGNGILSDTNDDALGDDVITDSTVDDSGFKDGLWTRIKNFFTGSDDDSE
ncbi:MAG: DUF1002 domain-containing protein [Firmicutes bacterium]|nr:DUF1002 domain-containing protein [Bacillota bacterium]NBI63919.1 DUF1002 domain-containing protein [Clostridiales bacterium]